MNRSKEPRELQFTSGQLVVVFVLIIALGAFIFILGVSVGKKQARLAEGPVSPSKTSVEKVARQAKPAGEPKTRAAAEAPSQASRPSTSGEKAAKSDIQQEIASFQAQQKTPKATAQETKPKPATSEAKIPPKSPAPEIKTQPKSPAASSNAKIQPKTAVSSLCYIQVTAATQKTEAIRVAESIKALGFPAVVLDPLPTDRTPYYRVRVGGYPTEQDRSLAADRLAVALNKKTSDFYYPPLEKIK
ncbi:MAG TPA: SPOR domain-containing protein [Acidobacteriota bacterium]